MGVDFQLIINENPTASEPQTTCEAWLASQFIMTMIFGVMGTIGRYHGMEIEINLLRLALLIIIALLKIITTSDQETAFAKTHVCIMYICCIINIDIFPRTETHFIWKQVKHGFTN